MLILLTYPPPADVRSGNIVHRPDLTVADALRTVKPDVLITHAPVTPAELSAWRTGLPHAPLLVFEVGSKGPYDTAEALKTAERTWNQAMSPKPPRSPSSERSVTLVGAGIVNLVTALHLGRHGYEVAVYDGAPDPRDNAHWTAYGCTRGGGDGRMFTLTEADSYNSRSWPSKDLLERPISDHGWLVSKPGSLTEPELAWAEEFHQIPPWLADSYNDDIFTVNRAAGARWAGLIESDPWLFDDGTGYSDGILRLYTEADYFRQHVTRNDRVGATRRVLTPSQVGADYPALEDACADGTVAGGIEVTGFTVNIHKFVARLVDTLELEGVRFHWNEQVSGIRWVAPGIADGLETATGQVVRSRHYVLSPGAYGDELLRGTASQGKIQGMLGVWFTVPNVEPQLEHSVKIARKGHRAEETNVTLATGEQTLIFGSGYGWTGLQPGNIDSTELDVLFDALEDTLRCFFPRAHAAARDAGTLDASRQVCVRPWTASCLGVFERLGTAGGGTLIVTGGHNTGGFAQCPVVADAVLAAFDGREHTMHSRYDPRRLARFYALTSLRITS